MACWSPAGLRVVLRNDTEPPGLLCAVPAMQHHTHRLLGTSILPHTLTTDPKTVVEVRLLPAAPHPTQRRQLHSRAQCAGTSSNQKPAFISSSLTNRHAGILGTLQHHKLFRVCAGLNFSSHSKSSRSLPSKPSFGSSALLFGTGRRALASRSVRCTVVPGRAAAALVSEGARRQCRRIVRRSAGRNMPAAPLLPTVAHITLCTFNIRGIMDRWEERQPLLKQCIKTIGADVYGFQEVLTGPCDSGNPGRTLPAPHLSSDVVVGGRLAAVFC